MHLSLSSLSLTFQLQLHLNQKLAELLLLFWNSLQAQKSNLIYTVLHLQIKKTAHATVLLLFIGVTLLSNVMSPLLLRLNLPRDKFITY